MERYEKYKDSGVEWIGEIPEGWEVKKVKYLLNDSDGIKIGPFGSSLKLSTLTSSGIKIYGQGNVIKDDFIIGSRYLSFERFEEGFSQYEIIEGDVLVTMMGTTGKSKIFREIYEKGILDSHLLRLRFKRDKLLPELFVVLLEFAGYIIYQIRINSKGSIMEGLNSSIIKELGIIVPPRPEQTIIANYLDRKTAEIDELIAQKERLLELYKEEKTAIISQAVTKGIDPDVKLKDSGIDWLGEIPEGWDITELRRFVHFITSGSRGWAEHYADDGKIFIRIGNLTRDSIGIDLSDIQYVIPPNEAEGERTKIFKDDILFSITAYIGAVAVAIDKIVGAYINQHIALVRLAEGKINPKYVAYVAFSDTGQSQLSGHGYGGTKVQLALDDVKSLLITVPSRKDQTAIVHHIETETARINAKIAKTKKIIALQKEYRTALISEVVTGKIKVTAKEYYE